MKKTAFIFPGQGSQFVGMAKGFYESSKAAKDAFDTASAELGFDMAKLCFEGPSAELDSTENTQPALLTASVAALRALKENLAGVSLSPSFFAGHSLGEYTALVAAGVIPFKDALRLVRLRGKFMQEAVPTGTGKMCAVLGLDVGVIAEICKEASVDGLAVVPANINSPGQVVISGHAGAVSVAAGLAKAKGAKRVLELPVSVPSHSPLMEGAASRLRLELEKTNFGKFSAPVVTNVEAEPLSDTSRVRELLTRQMTSPVRWVDTIIKMKAEGVGLIIEIGPGKVLTGLVKRIDADIAAANLSDVADMPAVASLLVA
jgi:[acyl-carrier-protein] S-malonyltransferase